MSLSDGRIAIVGAGLMGHGIAQVFACAGRDVSLFDLDRDVLSGARERIRENLAGLGLDPAPAGRVQPTADLGRAVSEACLVIECVREDLPTKQKLFAEIEPLARADAILATNTSVIPITHVMGGLTSRERALGTHWWNPPHIVPLVEVIGTEWTSSGAIEATTDLLRAVGKVPVRVRRDVPGFIGNRLQHALWREAIALVEEGVCDAATIDLVVKNSFGPRLGVLGPMENADLVGLDLALAVHRTLFPHLARATAPSPYLEDLVSEGRLGMKTGSGFFEWSPEGQQEVRSRLLRRLSYADAETGGTASSSQSVRFIDERENVVVRKCR